jgi:hypothetical protein
MITDSFSRLDEPEYGGFVFARLWMDVDYLPPEVRSSSLNDRFGTVSG